MLIEIIRHFNLRLEQSYYLESKLDLLRSKSGFLELDLISLLSQLDHAIFEMSKFNIPILLAIVL